MPYNILLVDDDREFREELRDFLDEYVVKEAQDAQEALSILKKPNEIDLIILDVMMPGMKGTELLRKIKETSPSLGIIILTGFSCEDIAIEALQGRADDYLQKPIDMGKLKTVIEKILSDKEVKESAAADNIEGKIKRVLQFGQRNFHKKVCLQDAAQVVYLSPKYLSRVFKNETGFGFSDYMQNVKVSKAKEFLTKTSSTVDSVSDQLGYLNTESFIRIFKKITGKTPTGFRKASKKSALKSKHSQARMLRGILPKV